MGFGLAECIYNFVPQQVLNVLTLILFPVTYTLRALIEEGRAHNKRIYCCFVDFRKAFDTVPRARLMQRLEALGVPTMGNYELY